MKPSVQMRCSACGATFDEGAWEALRLAERIGAAALARLVLGWSLDECIEVRACSECGKAIAAKRSLMNLNRVDAG